MNILVTGGTGFIGSHLIPLLLKKHKVYLLKRKTSDTWRIKSYISKITQLNIEDGVEKIFSHNKIDGIIHLAASYIKQHPNSSQLKKMNEGNINFPAELLDFAMHHKLKFFINTGTCFEYESSKHKISETHKLKPYNYYAATKIAFEHLCRFYSEQKGVRILTLKLFFPYGEMDNEKLMVRLIKSIMHNKKMPLTKGEQKLDFTHVSDIANAYLKAIEFISSSKYKQYEVFNIGTGVAQQVKVIAKILQSFAKSSMHLDFGSVPYEPNEIMHMQADISKAKKILKWESKMALEDGLSRTYNYYRSKI